MRAELRDLAGSTSADVNGNGNDADKGAHKNHRHHPRRDVTEAQRVIKRYDIGDRRAGVVLCNLHAGCLARTFAGDGSTGDRLM